MHQAQVELRIRVSLIGRQPVPLGCLCVVLNNVLTVSVEYAKINAGELGWPSETNQMSVGFSISRLGWLQKKAPNDIKIF